MFAYYKMQYQMVPQTGLRDFRLTLINDNYIINHFKWVRFQNLHLLSNMTNTSFVSFHVWFLRPIDVCLETLTNFGHTIIDIVINCLPVLENNTLFSRKIISKLLKMLQFRRACLFSDRVFTTFDTLGVV